MAGGAAFGSFRGLESWLGSEGILVLLIQLLIPGLVGVLIFALGAILLPIPEAGQLLNRLKQKISRR